MAASIPFILVPFGQGDYADFRLLTQSDRVMEMITGSALSEAESKVHFEKVLQQNSIAPGFGNFKIINEQNQEFIGLAKLVLETADDKEVEIGFMLTESYQGKGIATEATRRLLETAGAQKTLTRVKAILDPQNKASRKILVGAGFVSEFVGEIDGLPGEVMSLLL
ncbi:Protein N-acetyltransferase, RimJ/RimL family [Arachidicoccus rhizosphaerae]|uniref:Protein N-acetyltransferase, RimJ/RimL family n=1 Tax=Arachidicoccus rhizosphaerae TaxID=551991 RepID=A0A1H4C6Z8_9BACT|nr:GNAT family N-acetyltransferase [Arachidicoccus rhizosphaerae]SEA56127.1 Protein N-acetyltransferase, RimJ/RimL family [Arachidicoccus rhizosphaerae]